MAKVLNGEGLTSAQVRILNMLCEAGVAGMPAKDLVEDIGVPVTVQTIGPVFESDKYPLSLRNRGLVYPEKYEGDDVRWCVTYEGAKIGKTKKGRKIGGDSLKIPPSIFDPVLLAFKLTRAYGIEQYTDADKAELLAKIVTAVKKMEPDALAEAHGVVLADKDRFGHTREWSEGEKIVWKEEAVEAYKGILLEDLGRQADNRRKQGAFKDVKEQEYRAWKRILTEFGAGGTMLPGFLSADQEERLRKLVHSSPYHGKKTR